MNNLVIKKNILNERSDILFDYFNDIKHFPIISVQAEKILAERAKNGDEEAKNTLIQSNLRFVVTCAKQYVNQGVPLVDLISAGNKGLVLALNNYCPEKGYRFLTFAIWYIRREILKEIYNNGRMIRYPITFISNITKVKKAYDKFIKDNDREPSEEELIELADISQKQYNALTLDKSYCQSIDTTLTEDSKTTLQEIIPDNSIDLDKNLITNEILQCINTLPAREMKIIKEYFGIGCPSRKVQEIAEDLRIGPERVRQLRKSGLKKLEKFKNILKPLYGEIS